MPDVAAFRLSVVVPCHNAVRYLPDALASIRDQSLSPDEVILIDDGSTDDSHLVAERFAPLVRCVRQENRGISEARNRGIALATGDIIAFLDADDLWTDGSLSARAAVLAADPAVDCVAGMVEQFVSPELPDEIRRTLVCPPGASAARVAGTMLVRRHVFDRVGLFDASFHVGETLDWVARAAAAGTTMRAIDAVVLRRRIHGANTTARNARIKTDYLRVLKASLDRRRVPASSPTNDQS
ncbi:MAG TPA: glycosyltransferase [Gemmatimonadaceae bacterium]|nr:glycosyltransferase [Gemmatimonadaceae bacterium]